MRVSLLAVLLALLAATSAPGQNYSEKKALGLAIYKALAFEPDTAAVLVEYTGRQDFPAVTYFQTANGNRVTVPNKTAEVIFLPYPGKGEMIPDAALLLIESATRRFPQYQKHLTPLLAAWKSEAKRPPGEVEAEIKRREENTAKAAAALARAKEEKKPAPTPPEEKEKPVPGQEAATDPKTESTEDSSGPSPSEIKKALQTILDLTGGGQGEAP